MSISNNTNSGICMLNIYQTGTPTK